MTYEEQRLGHGQESHDGQVNVRLGLHKNRLSELMGQPTPEQYPVTFFEVPKGSVPTVEQVRVLHFFNQELRNILSGSVTSESLLSRYVPMIQQHGESSYLSSFQERIPKAKAAFDNSDRFVGEAQELLATIQETLARLSSDESPKLSPEQRDQALQACRAALEQVVQEERTLTEKSLRDEPHTHEESQRYIYLQGNENELRAIILYYKMLPLEEVNSIIEDNLESIAELEKKVQATRSMSQVRRLLELKAELGEMQAIASDYDGYVARYNSESVIPNESKRYQVIAAQLQEAIDAYIAPDLVDGDTSVRQRLEAIFKMPEARAALAAGSAS